MSKLYDVLLICALRKKVQVKGSRKGIKTEVNLMSSYQACPDRTHLKPVKRSAFCIKSMSNYLVTYVYALYLN
ncbi:hypothetical protein HanPSC8_Chr06g0241561 [Helianthus annuus]|nr:hypothetical protein HanPSC8_Chr06g0241561 [Helianthus annuus]